MNVVTAAIRALLADSDEVDPAKLAIQVDAYLRPEDREAVWLRYLTDAVRLEIGRERRRTPPSPGTHTSPRLAASADWWTRQLRCRVFTGSTWKFFGEMTLADVLTAAADRHRSAQAMENSAARFEALAAEMTALGVDKVADLPAEVGTRALRGAA